MRAELPANPFPPVNLSADDKRGILDNVDVLLDGALRQYEAHVFGNKGVVPSGIWKLAKTRNGVSVYRKRQTALETNESPKVASTLAVGSVPGSVDDMLLGSLGAHPKDMAAYTAVVSTHSCIRSEVLAPILLPTRIRPELSVVIKWMAFGSLWWTLNRVVTLRDFVVVEATGSTINSMGERVGYHIIQSIDVPGAPELVEFNMLRAFQFFGFLYRQVSPEHIDVFITCRVDPKGDIPAELTMRTTLDGLIRAVTQTKRLAEVKKRTWLYRQHTKVLPDSSNDRSECGVCTKPLNSVLLTRRTCAVCHTIACASCTDPQQVIDYENISFGRAALKKVVFCLRCLRTAHSLNAWDLAAAAADELNAIERSKADTLSSSSGSSTPVVF